ncbi:LOW QUALITY PROTEIN: uncharacterized protein LOC108094577 [Drosophila ficusphila]|uniref:LOW QUALITY PROTEIN: uncharacterized protein LOC108094577 n=1 Tax=Drosophila ficusphila TaxID=30025 RepID=UPI001C88E343|nr:LOW QUALITY PROTEIN: uncharacterized protein LOC108094577 [Drosophila ficusphila]
MLKWAVNQPRNSYLAKELLLGMEKGSGSRSGVETGSMEPKAEVVASSYSEFHALRGKLKRKSLGLAHGKENQLTSTPLPATTSSLTLNTRTPLLKDLSNILATPSPSVGVANGGAVAPLKFACTLPTFEAEYSPNAAVIPGSLIALRGVGIPDSYFEKPRYLEQKPLPHPHPHPHPHSHPAAPESGQTTLSSSQMGDVTLERMIDAILESNRKGPHPRQPRQHLRQRHRQQILRTSHTHTHTQVQTHSPTYRPAFDPASDLCEYWKSPSRRDSLPADHFEEREVRSPAPCHTQPLPLGVHSNGKRISLQLRRQRVVRRKRKIATKISSSVRQSAQKLLAAARSQSGGVASGQRCAQKRRHISPDSGHNSTSDFEEELMAMGSCAGRMQPAATKRRLSFSFAEDLFVEK